MLFCALPLWWNIHKLFCFFLGSVIFPPFYFHVLKLQSLKMKIIPALTKQLIARWPTKTKTKANPSHVALRCPSISSSFETFVFCKWKVALMIISLIDCYPVLSDINLLFIKAGECVNSTTVITATTTTTTITTTTMASIKTTTSTTINTTTCADVGLNFGNPFSNIRRHYSHHSQMNWDHIIL